MIGEMEVIFHSGGPWRDFKIGFFSLEVFFIKRSICVFTKYIHISSKLDNRNSVRSCTMIITTICIPSVLHIPCYCTSE